MEGKKLDVLSLFALIISITALGFSLYFYINIPKNNPKITWEVLPGTLQKVEKEGIKGFEGWIVIRNEGTFTAHNLKISLKVPEGEKFINLIPNYFSIMQNSSKKYILYIDLFDVGFKAPPIYFFSTFKPSIEVSFHEEMGTIPMPTD